MQQKRRRIGKLSNQDLERLILSKFHSRRPEVLVPPGVGLDCSLVDLGGDLCALSSDPITGATEKMGALAVHVSCNDAAASGAEPVGILTTLLLPPDAGDDTVAAIAEDVAEAALQANVDVLGGHTEFTDAVTRPLISATVLARARQDHLVNAAQLAVGDSLYMSKWAALEASFILAADHPSKVDGALSTEEWKELLGWVNCLSVVPEALLAVSWGAKALHDATEGGVLGAAWEMATASGVGLTLEGSKIPLQGETKKLFSALGIDPLRAMTSGALLIGLRENKEMEAEFAERGIPLAKIGMVLPQEQGICMDGKTIAPPEEDELYRVLG